MRNDWKLRRKTFSGPLLPLLVPAACLWTLLQVVLVWSGWAFDRPILRSGLDGAVSVNPITALAFLFLAAGLWLLRHPHPRPLLQRAGRLAAAVVIALALARIGDYLFGWQLGWDQWLFREHLDSQEGLPNRMAPNTAVCFILLGNVLLLFDRRSLLARRLAVGFALLTVLVAWVAVIGYVYSTGYP